MPAPPDRLDEPRQMVGHRVGAEAADERQAPRRLERVEACEERLDVVRRRRLAHFDGDRVAERGRVGDVRAVGVVRPQTDPRKVRAQVVRVGVARDVARQGGLVVEQQGLVTGEELGALEICDRARW